MIADYDLDELTIRFTAMIIRLSHRFGVVVDVPANDNFSGLGCMSLLDQLNTQARVLRLRDEIMPSGCKGEVCWNMLSDLALAYLNGRKVSISSACIGSHAPLTTGMRAVCLLVNHGLAERNPNPDDRRRYWLSITAAGFAIVKAAFGLAPLSCAANARAPLDGRLPPCPDRPAALVRPAHAVEMAHG